MRPDSPLVLALAGTLALHTLFVVGADAVIVTNPREPTPPAPKIELVEIEVPPVLEPPPPPLPEPTPPEPAPPEPTPPPVQEPPKPRAARATQQQVAPETPSPAEPPAEPSPDPGGAPTVAMPDIAPAATGVPVAPGPRNTGKIGRGGTGTGTGEGTGSGREPDPPPVSVATIKTRALPKGDHGVWEAGKDYPAEARQLAIEGVIRVRLVVSELGKVKSAVLLNKLGHGLDELALSRARQIEFEPARDSNDKAVSSVVVWTFNMTLPK